ncbi:MAG: glycosyltransferase [Chloroflexi bacterium]|nr:glycosyltransferase [Chloroflexota bacterium]
MKLLYLTFSPLDNPSGHLARLVYELQPMSTLNKITIVCLRKGVDSGETKNKYPNISFLNIDTVFDGWEITNLREVMVKISNIVKDFSPDLTILQMEVWELLRELRIALKGLTVFAAGLHAMPFLVSPLKPSGDFEKDVIDYLSSGLEDYKRNYISRHYAEAKEVFYDTAIIAQYPTVEYLVKAYFPMAHVWTLTPSILAEAPPILTRKSLVYDFVYMARMERGKGVEYLDLILKKIAHLLGRKIKVAVMGKCDDNFSKQALAELLEKSKENIWYEMEFSGWADSEKKIEILSKSRVFLYPSHYDTLATVVHEALAVGLPCVLWDVLFSQLNYSSNRAVLRAPLLDFDSFAGLAIRAYNDYSSLGTAALKYVQNSKTPQEIAELDTKLYASIVADEHERHTGRI